MLLQEWYDDDNEDYDAEELKAAIKEEHDALQKTQVFDRVRSQDYDATQLHDVIQTKWVIRSRRQIKTTESKVCSKRVDSMCQHRRNLRSNTSGNYVENATYTCTTQGSQHIHVRHTISILEHTNTARNHNTCETTTGMRTRPKHTMETEQTTLRSTGFQQHLLMILKKLGLRQLRSDQCVYRSDDITVMVYVDDLLLIGDDYKIKTFLQSLEKELQLKHVTKLQRDQPLVFLGRQIEYYGDHIALSMTQDYYKSLLAIYSVKENTNSLSTTGTKRPPVSTSNKLDEMEHKNPKTTLDVPLPPDIQYAVKELTRAVQGPDDFDKQNAKHLLRYLHGTRHHNLHLKARKPTSTEPYVKAYCDSDWAGCTNTRKSTAGTVLQFAGVTIATSSKTQQTIALSSAEAELYAIGTTVNDVIYVRNFLHELQFANAQQLIPQIYTDSSSAKCLTQQLGLTKRTKHIDLRYLHVQQLQHNGELKIHKVSTENNPADLMTKYLETAKIKKHSEYIGLHPYAGNKSSINMITRPTLRPRGHYTTTCP
eukprot:5172389-Amphidinium_carterae.3